MANLQVFEKLAADMSGVNTHDGPLQSVRNTRSNTLDIHLLTPQSVQSKRLNPSDSHTKRDTRWEPSNFVLTDTHRLNHSRTANGARLRP